MPAVAWSAREAVSTAPAVIGVDGVLGVVGVVGSGGGGVPPSESEVAATWAAGAAPALAAAGSVNTRWIRSSCPENVEKPSPSIGHGVTISVGRTDGSSEASSFARSRAAMFDWDTREPSTDMMSIESPPAPWVTCTLPIFRS